MPTTIQVNLETKEKLKTFGKKGETYEEIINRLYDIAVQQQLREFLFSGKAIPIEDAIKRAKQRWSK